MTYFKPENVNGKWIVRMEIVDGTEKSESFDSEKKANDFILEELGSYVETGLTKTQQDFIMGAWDKLRFDELTREAFGNPSLDGRTKQGRAIKKFLSERKLVPQPTYKQKLPDKELTDKDKEYIRTNLSTHNAIEMAREIFNSPVVPLSKEHRAVDAYIKSLPVVTGSRAGGGLAVADYEPPKSFDGTIKRINKYSHIQLDKDKLQPQQKKGVEALTSNLNSPRFMRTMNACHEQQDRDSFESEFIRHTWDKPDLTAEDLNLYTNLCYDYIIMYKILAQIEALDARLKDIVSDPQGEVTMRLTEIISTKTKEYDQCFERHRKLSENLSTKRADRLKKDMRDNASVLALILAWKNEEERKRWIFRAQAKEKEAKTEAERLETMDEMKARILGIGVMEAVHGL